MELHGTTIAHSLNLKTTDSFHAVEVFRVGMNTIKLPSILSIRFSGNQLDTDIKTFRSDEADIEGYDVWSGNDDAIKCLSCQSPEAIDRCIGIKKAREPELKRWVECDEEIAPLCSDCASNRFLSGSGGYVGVTMPPPSGYITHYIKDDTSYSRSAGHIRNPGITRKFTRYVTSSRSQAKAVEAKVKAPVTFRYTSTYMVMADNKYADGLITEDQYDFIMDDLITRI